MNWQWFAIGSIILIWLELRWIRKELEQCRMRLNQLNGNDAGYTGPHKSRIVEVPNPRIRDWKKEVCSHVNTVPTSAGEFCADCGAEL